MLCYAFLQLWLRAFLSYGLCIRIFQSCEKSISKIWLQRILKFMIYIVLKEKENLKLNSAHDYSYENGSYSFEIKYTDKAEPTILQKTFMCSNCLTLRHYYS